MAGKETAFNFFIIGKHSRAAWSASVCSLARIETMKSCCTPANDQPTLSRHACVGDDIWTEALQIITRHIQITDSKSALRILQAGQQELTAKESERAEAASLLGRRMTAMEAILAARRAVQQEPSAQTETEAAREGGGEMRFQVSPSCIHLIAPSHFDIPSHPTATCPTRVNHTTHEGHSWVSIQCASKLADPIDPHVTAASSRMWSD